MAEAPPKKQASERRKQQNRVAQKGYRERQKRRMQALERLLDVHQNCLEDSSNDFSSTTVIASENGLATQATSAAGTNPTTPSVLADSSSTAGSPGVYRGNEIHEPAAHQNAGSLMQFQPTQTSNLLLRERVLDQLMQEIDSVDETIYSRIISKEISINQIFQAGLRHVLTDLSHNPSSNVTPSMDGLETALRTDKILVPENSMQVHTHALPDIYANHLRLKQFTEVAALRASAEAIGLSFDVLTDPDAESPFYRESISKDAAETMVKEEFDNVVPHLRPTIAQIRYSHHPYLDALPFPTLRGRIIEACSLESPLFEEEDLCDDLEKGGLICWGSYLGGENGATGFGCPWDYRSWEAQPWFLKKWWFFIGGEQGELFQQTRWWHELRGDRLVAPW
ncbi:hypothetical protein BJX68DRAFT_260536 [Aspergillus pseudodeflectus]|uniref:BZIP domain-containing protein n=1 Tax=Aspergillus pseudodeflectus TaxID=176178 RepID=A0ABR4LB08_9EURO